jgi:hypothetical protein
MTSVLRWPRLTDILAGIPWAIAGAVAARRYMPERATTDLDIVVLPGSRQEVESRLRAAGFEQTGRLAVGGSAWRSPEDVPLDVLEGNEPWWPQALAACAENLDEEGAPVLTLPYLVLMKLLSGRVQDIADVTRMVGHAADEELGQVRAVVASCAADVSADLESLIELGRLETGGQPA